MKRVMSIARQILILGAVLSFNAGLLFSCRDKIDESDMYSFTGMQIIDYLNTNDSTTYFA